MTNFKLKLIYWLISIVAFLLLINVALEYFTPASNQEAGFLSLIDFKTAVNNTAVEYALGKEFLKFKNVRSNKDSLKCFVNIKLPKDILTPLFLRDLLAKLDKPFVNTIVKRIKGATYVSVFSNNREKFKIKIRKLKDIKRASTKLRLVVKFDYDIDSTELKIFLNKPFPLNFLIIPSKNNYLMKDYFQRSGNAFGILLNDNIKDSRYLLERGLSRYRLKKSINSIINDFNDARFYFIDVKSRLYKSVIVNFLFDEFSARKIKLIKMNRFVEISERSKEETISKFKFFENSLKGKPAKTIIITPESIYYLLDYLPAYFKKGNYLVGY